MLEFQTAGSIYSTILMQEPQPVAVLLVEGPDDDSLLEDHLAEGVMGLVCGGKNNVVEAAGIAYSQGQQNVLGLIDRDLNHATGLLEELPANIVETTTYDLTADIADAIPRSIERVLNAHEHRATRIVRDARGESIDDAVIDLVSRFAGVRISVALKRYPLRLKAFQFSDVVGTDFSTLGEDIFISSLVASQKDFSLDDQAREHIIKMISLTAGRRDLCGGHDIAAAACALISQAGASQISRDTVEAGIRLMADCSALASLSCIIELQRLCAISTGHPMFDCFQEVDKEDTVVSLA